MDPPFVQFCRESKGSFFRQEKHIPIAAETGAAPQQGLGLSLGQFLDVPRMPPRAREGRPARPDQRAVALLLVSFGGSLGFAVTRPAGSAAFREARGEGPGKGMFWEFEN